MYIVEMVDGSTKLVYTPPDGGLVALVSDESVEFRDNSNRLLAFFPVASIVSVLYEADEDDEEDDE